ncbi:MAG TPA: hypothetical protein PLK12_06130 [Prolixibacteraceae bacterium]|nr:hypothetical protein [Prolixibacteraceae bacterium]
MNILVKIGAIAAILLASFSTQAGSKSEKIYQRFAGSEGVTTLGFSHSAIEPIEFFLDRETRKVIYRMERIRFMLYQEEKGRFRSEQVFDRITGDLKGGRYFEIDPDEIDSSSDPFDFDEDEVKMIGHGKRQKMDEVHFVINDRDYCILVSFYGDISVEDLKECARFGKSAHRTFQ